MNYITQMVVDYYYIFPFVFAIVFSLSVGAGVFIYYKWFYKDKTRHRG